MRSRVWIFGSIIYVLLWTFVYVNRIHVPASDVFASDAAAYSQAAQHLLSTGSYALDDAAAFTEREPGYSVFLGGIYTLFGVENVTALYAAQGLLFLLASLFFTRSFARIAGERAGMISFFLLVVSFSILHATFTAFREGFTLVLLLLSAGLFLRFQEDPRSARASVIGLLLGCAILTYYSLVFLPVAFALSLLRLRVPLRHVILMVGIPLLFVLGWNLRNAVVNGNFGGTATQRMATVWYVRGVQARDVQGLEPLKCLWAEYVSRDWSGRSPACSLNGVKNTTWPEGMAPAGREKEVTRAGWRLIREHPFSYLWFSVIEIVELHLPFVGGGWSFQMNLLSTLTAFLMYVGLTFGIAQLRDRRLWILLLFPLYNTLSFILTDATPRYLIPVIFCYAAIAGIGYDRLWRIVHK